MERSPDANYPPVDFDEVFSAEEEPVVVGGQAVNIWASYYASRTQKLAECAPFTSCDADVFWNREKAESFAKRKGWTFVHFSEFRQPMVGILTKKIEKGELVVDVMRSVLGIGKEDIENAAVCTQPDGKKWRVLNPVSLFNLRTAVNAGGFAQSFGRLRLALSAPRTARCASGKRKPHPPQNLAQTHPAELPFLGSKAKMTNLVKLDNSGADGRKRNDDTQAKSITVVCGYYLADYADSVRNDSSLSERLLVKEFANLFEIIGRVDFRAAAKKFGINLDDAMPQVGTEGLPKLQKFYAHKFTRSAAA